MAATIVSTPGSDSANSFVSLAEFDTYLSLRLNATSQLAESPTKKVQAIVEATRDLNVQPWDGLRATTTQALAFPCVRLTDPDDPTCAYFADDVIPQRVKDATCELALQYLKAGTTDLAAADPSMGIKRKKVDVLETEYFEPYRRPEGLSRFTRVQELIRPLLRSTASSSSIELVRG